MIMYSKRKLRAAFFAVSVSVLSLTACTSFDKGHASIDNALQLEVTQLEQDMFPATPLEFAQRYAEFTEELDAAGVNTLVSKQMTLILANGSPQKTYTRTEQLAALTEIYRIEKAAGKKIQPADYIITQHSDDFAVVKFTWEVEDPTQERINYACTSYVIRREAEGWRLVFVMELGAGLGGAPQA